MGSWGTGLYSNDTSLDVRDMCSEVYPLVGIEEGSKLILKEYADIVNSDVVDNDCADFWLALADWQWKHGVLTDAVKEKAISLIEMQAGIDEWEGSSVKKRLTVMKKLREQLKKPQSEARIPKAKITKPKHKPGDIVVFRTCDRSYVYSDSVWNIDMCGFTDHYTAEIANKLPKRISPPFEAYEKYMAVLCVGSVREPHSQYVPDLMDEHSIYACYDYIDDKKPTLDHLKMCGFLPINLRYRSNGDDSGKNTWTYTFRMFAQTFSTKHSGPEEIIEKIYSTDESNRFHALFSEKQYDSEHSLLMCFYEMFSEIYSEKVRLETIGIKLDDLLDVNAVNPALRTVEEINRITADELKQWQMKADALEKSDAYQNADEVGRVLMLRKLVREDLAAE